MRLNSAMKQVIIRRIVDDLDLVDYSTKLHDTANEVAKGFLPRDLQIALAQHPKWILKAESVRTAPEKGWDYVAVTGGYLPEVKAAVQDALRPLVEARDAQHEKVDNLKAKLHSQFAGVSTAKTFAERFPEFANYLPEHAQPSESLPATTEVMEIVKQMGWPKSAKKAKPVVKKVAKQSKGVKSV